MGAFRGATFSTKHISPPIKVPLVALRTRCEQEKGVMPPSKIFKRQENTMSRCLTGLTSKIAKNTCTTPKRHFWSDSLSLQPPFSTSASQTACNQTKTGCDDSEKRTCAKERFWRGNIRAFVEKISKCRQKSLKCEQSSESAPVFDKIRHPKPPDLPSTPTT